MKRISLIGLLALTSPALADDALSEVSAPIDVAVKTQPAHYSAWWKRLYLRAGVAHLAPLSSSRELELADVDGPASL
ncbi:MAG: hypothetical protein NT062_09850, partial [Proteobacteria bacterium]|nr:hypothetical protein [Pseudomonadota bacterium]